MCLVKQISLLNTTNLLYGSKVIRWLGLQALQEVELRLRTQTSVREALTVLLNATEDERNQLVVDIAKLRKSHQLQECALQASHEALQVYTSMCLAHREPSSGFARHHSIQRTSCAISEASGLPKCLSTITSRPRILSCILSGS